MNSDSMLARDFNHFFVSRALSTFGDEIWAIALPIYFASIGFSVKQLGFYSSAVAVGTVAGFALLPRISEFLRASTLAITVDIIQLILFTTIAALVTSDQPPPFEFWIPFAILLAAAESIWFGSSEVLISKTVERSLSQSIHRMNYLSSNIGPVLAPFAASQVVLLLGLAAVALFNAATFLFQIFSLRGLQTHERSTPKSAEAPTLPFSQIYKHPIYFSMLLITSVVKVALLGVLPFIPFTLTKLSINSIYLAAILAAFPIGSLTGAWNYKPVPPEQIHRVFFSDLVIMFTFTAALVLGIKFALIPLIALGAFGSGLFCARYTIEIRSIRQLITRPELMPKLVSLQGLTSRIVTPLAGIIFGFLLSATSWQYSAAFLALAGLIAIGAAFAMLRTLPGFLEKEST